MEPVVAPSGALYRLTNLTDSIPVADLFPTRAPVDLEIGCGDGSFLARYAKLHPELNFFGIERLLGRVHKLEKKALLGGLTNLRILSIEASYLLRYLLNPESFSAIHVYFPDPWPKKKHHKNRLVNQEFTGHAEKLLGSRGWVHLRTDNLDYFEQMLRVFDAAPAFERTLPPEGLLNVRTDFETDFHKLGVPTKWVSYRKRS